MSVKVQGTGRGAQRNQSFIPPILIRVVLTVLLMTVTVTWFAMFCWFLQSGPVGGTMSFTKAIIGIPNVFLSFASLISEIVFLIIVPWVRYAESDY